MSLLLRRECCSLSNAEYDKAEQAELENWCYDANEEFFFAFNILYYDMCSSPSSVTDTVMAKWLVQRGMRWSISDKLSVFRMINKTYKMDSYNLSFYHSRTSVLVVSS